MRGDREPGVAARAGRLDRGRAPLPGRRPASHPWRARQGGRVPYRHRAAMAAHSWCGRTDGIADREPILRLLPGHYGPTPGRLTAGTAILRGKQPAPGMAHRLMTPPRP